MKRRDFVKVAGLGAASLAMPEALFAADPRTDKPNIVLVMADDLGAECLGCYGSTTYRTPNLDAMAKRGVRFENAYCTPLCTPTRAQLMTGQYPFRNGWPVGIWTKPIEERVFDPEQSHISHVLKSAGYATAVTGKWQLARFDYHPEHPAQCGFDEHCLWTWQYGDGKQPRYWDPSIWENGALLEGTAGTYGPDICCNFLLDFIRRHRGRPFFAYYPMLLTHGPFQMPPGAGVAAEGRAEGKGEVHQSFASMVAYMDKLVGDIVGTLDELGLRENTLVLFTADNGTPQQIKESRLGDLTIPGGKNSMTEAGARVPMIADWRGVTPAGRTVEDLTDFTDILPTLAQVAGAELPRNVSFDGRSFLPQLRGQTGNPREWVLVQLGNRWYLRGKRYRLDCLGGLHDMSRRYDPQEVRTLRPPAQAAQARARLEKAAMDLLGTTERLAEPVKRP